MELLDGLPIVEETEGQKLKTYLDETGRRYSWLAAKLDRTKAWMTLVMKGQIVLSQKHKKNIENLLPDFKF